MKKTTFAKHVASVTTRPVGKGLAYAEYGGAVNKLIIQL
jgi:hypothetical protein